jgi:hypothetical protein
MLCWIAILGGVLIMMGQHSRSEALFYYFRLEDQTPETHLLRLIDKHISFYPLADFSVQIEGVTPSKLSTNDPEPTDLPPR